MRDQLDDIEIKIEHMIQFVNKLKMSANFRQTYHDAWTLWFNLDPKIMADPENILWSSSPS